MNHHAATFIRDADPEFWMISKSTREQLRMTTLKVIQSYFAIRSEAQSTGRRSIMEIPFGPSIKYFTGPLHDSLSFQVTEMLEDITRPQYKTVQILNLGILLNLVILVSLVNLDILLVNLLSLAFLVTLVIVVNLVFLSNLGILLNYILYIVNVYLHLPEILGWRGVKQ